MNSNQLTPGEVFLDKYRVDRVLGQGAMGIVVAATHIALGQRVAIKFMLPSKSPKEQLARFQREARASVHLKSQHVTKVLDFGATPEGAPYMVLEYLEGRDLGAELQARGPLPVSEAVELVLQACDAVAEAHVAGIVHRDIKPANLFVSRGNDGVPCMKVLDFGISKVPDESVAVTSDLQILGSPLYMAPEQVRASKSVDARADIWALGVTLYELVCGWTPFHGDQIAIVIARLLEERPTPIAKYRADIPPAFEAVIHQCLEKDRDRRFPSVAAFVAALAPFAPEHAMHYVTKIAAVMGERVAPSRPTEVGAPVPAMTAIAPAPITSMTGGAVSTTTSGAAEPRRRARAGVMAIAAGLTAVALLVVGGAAAKRAGAPASGATSEGNSTTTATVTSTPTASAVPEAPTASSSSTSPEVAPAPTTSATLSPSASAAPTAKPVHPSRPPATKPTQAPSDGAPADLYDRGGGRR